MADLLVRLYFLPVPGHGRTYVSERTPSTTSCTAIAESSRPKTRVRKLRIAGLVALVTRSATISATPTQATDAMIAAITATWPPAPGCARHSTIEVAIAPGPATSGVASG